MDRIRSMTGVCPQHDILFETLTPREHLQFFAAVKVFRCSILTAQIVDLYFFVHTSPNVKLPFLRRNE